MATFRRTLVQQFGGGDLQLAKPHRLEDRHETVKQIVESGQNGLLIARALLADRHGLGTPVTSRFTIALDRFQRSDGQFPIHQGACNCTEVAARPPLAKSVEAIRLRTSEG